MLESKQILLIDDDPEDQEIFGIVVSDVSEVVKCTYENTAEDALRKLANPKEPKPDFIFLDLHLPLMSGFDCLQSLKKDSMLQNIPVIVYSTSSRNSDRQKARELGAINFVSKPDTIMELRAIIEKLLH